MLTSDRGLAGGFNSNVIRRASRFLYENSGQYERIQLSTVGRKGHDFFRKRGADDPQGLPGPVLAGELPHRRGLAEELTAQLPRWRGRRGLPRLQRVRLRHQPEGRRGAAAAAADLRRRRPRPPRRTRRAGARRRWTSSTSRAARTVLDRLVPAGRSPSRSTGPCWSAWPSEHGARMSAMENATSNASDMIGQLTLYLQPHPPGGHHQGADGDRLRRRGAEVATGRAALAGDRDHGRLGTSARRSAAA